MSGAPTVWRTAGRRVDLGQPVRGLSVEAPFGGYKESGTGYDLGLESLSEYLETKNIHLNIGTDTLDWYAVR